MYAIIHFTHNLLCDNIAFKHKLSKTIYENKKTYYEVLEQKMGFRIKENPLLKMRLNTKHFI
jgi:hypothetical protein